jgi:hypothetical protein
MNLEENIHNLSLLRQKERDTIFKMCSTVLSRRMNSYSCEPL